jgi:hypothetical protein
MFHTKVVSVAVGVLCIVSSGAVSRGEDSSPTPTPATAVPPSSTDSPSPRATSGQAGSAETLQPIVVLGCDVQLPGVLKIFVKHNAIGRTDHLQVDYKNDASKPAKKVVFGVYVSGEQVGQITDVGLFQPDSEQKHAVYGAQKFEFSLGNTECRAIQVEFADGSIWQSSVAVSTLATNILSQPDSPVTISKCNYAYSLPEAGNYDMDVAVWFENASLKSATAIRFGFVTYSAFDEVLATSHGTINGSFAPGIAIEPGYNPDALTEAGPQPGNAAWRFSSPNQTDAVRLSCFVDAVKFADGSIWMRPKE